MRSDLVTFGNAKQTFDIGVDKSNEVLKGVKVAQIGPVNDSRPYAFDLTTLEQIVELGNRPNKGLKCRLTHPDEEMGLHLGRWINFRIDGDCVRADLQIAKASHLSPSGDIGLYVMTMAEEDAEAIGASIATIPDWELMEGSAIDGLMPYRITELYAVDLVGNPAATRGGLFSVEKAMAEEVVEDVKKEEADYGFLSSDEMEPKDKVAKVAEMLGCDPPYSEKEEMAKVATEDAFSNPEPYLETFGTERGAVFFVKKVPQLDCFKILLEEQRAENAKLKAELEQMSVKVEAAKELGGEKEPISFQIEKPESLSAEQKVKQEKFAAYKANGASESTARWAAGLGSL